MVRRPRELSRRPVGLDVRTRGRKARRAAGSPRTADVLTELLDTLRESTLVYGRLELGAPWGIQLPDLHAAHFIVVGRGMAHLEVDGVRTPISLSAGDLALLPRGGAHVLRDDEGSALLPLGQAACRQMLANEPIRLGGRGQCTTLVIGAFRFRAAHRALSIQRLARVIHVPSGSSQAFPWLASTVQVLVAESTSRSPGAAVVVNRLADVLLVQAIRSFIAGGQCPEHGLRALADARIGRALALLHEHPAEAWTLERLAAAVALSRSGLASRFKALVGAAPLEYLARWRMARAARLLRESDLSLSEVAERIGYESEASFNKAFKRLQGTTPGAYRRLRDGS